MFSPTEKLFVAEHMDVSHNQLGAERPGLCWLESLPEGWYEVQTKSQNHLPKGPAALPSSGHLDRLEDSLSPRLFRPVLSLITSV